MGSISKDEIINELKEQLKQSILQNGRLDAQLDHWKEKFYALKNPEVVRTQIERYDDFLPPDFQYNEVLISKKSEIHFQNEERRRQKFDYMLKRSSDDFLISLRESIFIYWVEKPDLLKLDVSESAKKEGEKIRTILVEYTGGSDCVWSKMNFIYNHPDVHAGLEQVMLDGPDQNTNFKWLIEVFEEYSVRIANLHRMISHNIHQAEFDADDRIPAVYNILKDIKYKSCIQILMNDFKDFEKDA